MKRPTLKPSDFRAVYPQFADEERYPDAAIQYRLTVAEQQVGVSRWGDMYVHGVFLQVAHHLTIASAVASGNRTGGVVASKSGDGLSVSYDNTSSSETGAGFWNSTAYGREYWRLVRIYGMGAVQL